MFADVTQTVPKQSSSVRGHYWASAPPTASTHRVSAGHFLVTRSVSQTSLTMTEDVDMDAPQISTLREETTPEPNPARSSKFRVKLLVNDKAAEGPKAGSTSSKHGRPDSDDDEDEDEDEEEDQLIDDDDEEVPKPPPSVPPPVVAPVVATPPKRGGRGRGRGGGRGRGRGGRGGAPVPGPGVTWFETAPSEATSSQDARADVWDPSSTPGSAVPTPPTGRKKPGPPKGSTMNRTTKKRVPKYVVLYTRCSDTLMIMYQGFQRCCPTLERRCRECQ